MSLLSSKFLAVLSGVIGSAGWEAQALFLTTGRSTRQKKMDVEALRKEVTGDLQVAGPAVWTFLTNDEVEKRTLGVWKIKGEDDTREVVRGREPANSTNACRECCFCVCQFGACRSCRVLPTLNMEEVYLKEIQDLVEALKAKEKRQEKIREAQEKRQEKIHEHNECLHELELGAELLTLEWKNKYDARTGGEDPENLTSYMNVKTEELLRKYLVRSMVTGEVQGLLAFLQDAEYGTPWAPEQLDRSLPQSLQYLSYVGRLMCAEFFNHNMKELSRANEIFAKCTKIPAFAPDEFWDEITKNMKLEDLQQLFNEVYEKHKLFEDVKEWIEYVENVLIIFKEKQKFVEAYKKWAQKKEQ